MKTSTILALAVLAAAMTSCGAKKQAPVVDTNNPFQKTYAAPCYATDTEKVFAATGIAKGSSNQKGELHISALENAKDAIRSKVQQQYRAMIATDRIDQLGPQGHEITKKINLAGEQVIDVVLNEAIETCFQYSPVDERGMIECYVAIQIAKGDIADAANQKLSKVLSPDEQKLINLKPDAK